MKNVYVYCEGQTEEAFINEVLYPYLVQSGILVIPIICTTSRTRTTKHKGGVSDYFKIKHELILLCKHTVMTSPGKAIRAAFEIVLNGDSSVPAWVSFP